MDVFKLLKEKYNEYKIKKKKDKLFIKRQKEIIKKQQELNDEVEKEYKEEIKKEQEEKYKNISKKDRLIKDAKEFFEDLMGNKEFEELESVLSEEEKKREEELRKENKKITIKVVILFVTILTIITILSLILGEILKTDLEKVTQPMLEEYYKNTFTEKAKIKTIRYLDKEKHIVLATFTSDINLMCVDNEHIGNDVTYESIYQDYKNYLISNMQATNFIVDNPKLSYIPYLVEYNYYIDYIDTLPSDLSFKQMLNTKNLDIVDVILYEGDINKNNLMNMLGSFGDNSKLYLVKQSSQNILNLSIITKEYIKSFDVIEEKYSNDGDTFFRFNQEINKIDYVDITNYGPGYDNDNIHYTNVKQLKLKSSYLKGAYNEEDKRDAYFLIRLNKQFKYDKLTLLSSSLSYRKIENDKYPEMITIPSQNGFIVIGTKEIMIANQDSEKTSWFCRIDLC